MEDGGDPPEVLDMSNLIGELLLGVGYLFISGDMECKVPQGYWGLSLSSLNEVVGHRRGCIEKWLRGNQSRTWEVYLINGTCWRGSHCGVGEFLRGYSQERVTRCIRDGSCRNHLKGWVYRARRWIESVNRPSVTQLTVVPLLESSLPVDVDRRIFSEVKFQFRGLSYRLVSSRTDDKRVGKSILQETHDPYGQGDLFSLDGTGMVLPGQYRHKAVAFSPAQVQSWVRAHTGKPTFLWMSEFNAIDRRAPDRLLPKLRTHYPNHNDWKQFNILLRSIYGY